MHVIERFHVAAPDRSAALWINADSRPTTTYWDILVHRNHVDNNINGGWQ